MFKFNYTMDMLEISTVLSKCDNGYELVCGSLDPELTFLR